MNPFFKKVGRQRIGLNPAVPSTTLFQWMADLAFRLVQVALDKEGCGCIVCGALLMSLGKWIDPLYKGTPPSRSEVPGVPHPIIEHHLSFWMPSVIQVLPLNAWCLKSGLIYVLHEPDFFQHFYCFFCRLGNVPLLELPEVIPSQRY